jgi:hypothetical protein
MKTAGALARVALAAASTLASVAAAAPVAAAETGQDVETDHLDAFDDGGPRSFGLLVNPAALALGAFGAEGDFVLGDVAAASVEGDWISLGNATAYGAAVGLPVFPWRLIFHGFYLHPRVTWARATLPGATVDVLGAGATIGWQWTWRFGLTLRAGAGVSYARVITDGGPDVAIEGLRPLLDGDVGWVF